MVSAGREDDRAGCEGGFGGGSMDGRDGASEQMEPGNYRLQEIVMCCCCSSSSSSSFRRKEVELDRGEGDGGVCHVIQ
jgi:hypothetical protein